MDICKSSDAPLTEYYARFPLCFECAVRMSGLFQRPPPSPLRSVSNYCDLDHQDLLRDHTYHPYFVIISETSHSVKRVLPFVSESFATYPSWIEKEQKINELGNNISIPDICVACGGLYQFLDHIHAPTVAVNVRCSPHFDSKSLCMQVNIPRNITLWWLKIAILLHASQKSSPLPSYTLPDGYFNFKDFYGNDLRARVMAYLRYDKAGSSDSKGILDSKLSSLPGISIYEVLLHKYLDSSNLVSAKGEFNKFTSKESATVSFTDGKDFSCDCLHGLSESTPSLPLCLQSLTYSPADNQIIVQVEGVDLQGESAFKDDFSLLDMISEKNNPIITYGMIYNLTYRDGKPKHCPSVLMPRSLTLVKTKVLHRPLFLIGTYRKMSRNLSQSPWFYKETRIGALSLQEIIAKPFLHFFFPFGIPQDTSGENKDMKIEDPTGSSYSCILTSDQSLNDSLPKKRKPCQKEGSFNRLKQRKLKEEELLNSFSLLKNNVLGYSLYKFHSAGREDRDVRMLGKGRPFVLEIHSPHRSFFNTSEIKEIENKVFINSEGMVEISNVCRATEHITVDLARHSESKSKRYRCVVWCSRKLIEPSDVNAIDSLNNLKDFRIYQKTPIRVLHRRALLTREKNIFSVHAIRLNPHWLLIDLVTQAGTYVKEFIHGDMGRTLPNLGTLLCCQTDIIQLDVLGVSMPFLQDNSPEKIELKTD